MAYAPEFAAALRAYRPSQLRLLFVAEAPPALNSGRFFYFPKLQNGDTLFLEMMKVLYPRATGFSESTDGSARSFDARRVRMGKGNLLQRFRSDGLYLMDASDQPMPNGADSGKKRQIIREALPQLRSKVLRLCDSGDVPIILIGSPAYLVCAEAFRKIGLKVLNEEMINHPARGGQKHFREKLTALVRKHRIHVSDDEVETATTPPTG